MARSLGSARPEGRALRATYAEERARIVGDGLQAVPGTTWRARWVRHGLKAVPPVPRTRRKGHGSAGAARPRWWAPPRREGRALRTGYAEERARIVGAGLQAVPERDGALVGFG